MDCRTARLLLEFARPRANEFPQPEGDELRRHLDICTECASLAEADRRADEHLGRAMRDVPVPSGLKARLLERLKTEHGQRRLRWVGGLTTVGVAASLFLVVGLLWAFSSPKTEVDVATALQRVADKTANPSPDWVEQWFHDRHGIHMIAPRQLNQKQLDYTLLQEYDLVPFADGKQVPKLVFVRGKEGKDRLMVFVLSQQRFTLNSQVEESQGWTAEVERTDSGFNYLLFYKGGQLKDFCQAQQAG